MIYYNCYETYATNNSFRHVFDLSKNLNISNLRYELQVAIHCTCVRESPTRRTFFHRDLAGVTPADMITSTYGGLFGLIFYYTSKPDVILFIKMTCFKKKSEFMTLFQLTWVESYSSLSTI